MNFESTTNVATLFRDFLVGYEMAQKNGELDNMVFDKSHPKHSAEVIVCIKCGHMTCPNGVECCGILPGDNIQRALFIQRRFPCVEGLLRCGHCGRNNGLQIQRVVLEEEVQKNVGAR